MRFGTWYERTMFVQIKTSIPWNESTLAERRRQGGLTIQFVWIGSAVRRADMLRPAPDPSSAFRLVGMQSCPRSSSSECPADCLAVPGDRSAGRRRARAGASVSLGRRSCTGTPCRFRSSGSATRAGPRSTTARTGCRLFSPCFPTCGSSFSSVLSPWVPGVTPISDGPVQFL